VPTCSTTSNNLSSNYFTYYTYKNNKTIKKSYEAQKSNIKLKDCVMTWDLQECLKYSETFKIKFSGSLKNVNGYKMEITLNGNLIQEFTFDSNDPIFSLD
jgi:hypothetical protein